MEACHNSTQFISMEKELTTEALAAMIIQARGRGQELTWQVDSFAVEVKKGDAVE